jgi:hypothetical protein
VEMIIAHLIYDLYALMVRSLTRYPWHITAVQRLLATPVGCLPGGTFGSPAITVPQTPHRLQPPATPIAPVFARPVKTSTIKFVVYLS